MAQLKGAVRMTCVVVGSHIICRFPPPPKSSFQMWELQFRVEVAAGITGSPKGSAPKNHVGMHQRFPHEFCYGLCGLSMGLSGSHRQAFDPSGVFEACRKLVICMGLYRPNRDDLQP